MAFNFDFFEKDLQINKRIITEEINNIKNEHNREKQDYEREVESFKTMNKEDQMDFMIDTWFSPAKHPSTPIVLSQDTSLNDPYFFFCTDEDMLVYQSSLDLNIKRENKKIVRFTDYRARHLRFKDRSWNNKFNITIEKWILKSIEPIMTEPIDTFNISSLVKTEEKITINRKKKTSGMGDISRLMKKEQDEIMWAPIEWTTLIKWVAWSGKTNILLHRIQYLLWEHPSKFSQEKILFMCYNVWLKKYIHSMIKNNFPRIDVQTIDKRQKDTFSKYVWWTYSMDFQDQATKKDVEQIVNPFIKSINDIKEFITSEEYSKSKTKELGTDASIILKIDLAKILKTIFPETKEYAKFHMYIALYILSVTETKQKKWSKEAIITIWDREFNFSHSKTNFTTVRYLLNKPKYDHIFIDEIQDLLDIQLKIFDGFHNNSMTLAGDETQLLSWNKSQKLEDNLGIKIDRQFFLETSHRNSLQTAIFANEILKNINVKSEIQKIWFSWLKPIIKQCADNQNLVEYLINKINDLIKNEPSASICITQPKNDNLEKLERDLKSAWINCYIAKWQERDFSKKIHITNYYQAKWLEFDYMFILGINDFLGRTNIPNKENVFYTIVTRAIKRVYMPFIWTVPNLLRNISKNSYEMQ